MSSPRIEVRLDRIEQNARTLVDFAATRGVSITGVTKAMRGLPALGTALIAAGVTALGDARVDNIERLRSAGIAAPIVLLRSPLPSQVERVVAAADSSCNTEIAVVEMLSRAAVAADRRHGVILMVELGDLREGIMPADVPDAVHRALTLPNIKVAGIGANLACRSGVVPDDSNMATLSALAASLEQRFGIALRVVSGGNSANLHWLRTSAHLGRIDNLRLGEAILLGTDPLDGTPIEGLHVDTAALSAEVIESKHKPRQPWGDQASTPFAPMPAAADSPEAQGCGWQAIVALGHQDTDPADLTPPEGIQILGASSDHLVIGSREPVPIGAELWFRPGYSALARAMTAPSVEQVVLDGDRSLGRRAVEPSGRHDGLGLPATA